MSLTRLLLTVGLVCVLQGAVDDDARAQATDAGAASRRINELSRAGRYAEATPLAEALVARLENSGPSRDLAGALNNLALLYADQGRDADAEPIYRRALSMQERVTGLDSVEIAPELNNLAALYQRQLRYTDAEPLFRRALAIRERALGPSHADVGQSLNNLATLFERQDRHAESEPLFRRALAIYQKVPGADPAVATLLNNLGQVYKAMGRTQEAEPVIRQSLAIREKVLGPDHPDVARSLNNLAGLYQNQQRFAESEPLYLRALAIRERAVGAAHPDTAASLNNLASMYHDAGRDRDALPLVERVRAGGRAQARAALPVLFGAAEQQLMPREQALDAALDVIQRGGQSSAAAAVNKLAARLAAGTDRLAELVRRDQDLAAEAEALDKSILTAVAKPGAKRDPAAESRSKARIAVIATERAGLEKVLASEFPDYAALSNPAPVRGGEVQALIAEDEAVVLFSVLDRETHVIAITRTGVTWKFIPLGADAMAIKVAAFRRGLDVGQARDATGKANLFDLALAHELYGQLLGPVDDAIRTRRSLMIVPAGALTALPFHLLVTDRPSAAIPGSFDGYRDAAWLLKRQSVSILPSIASLKALRGFPRVSQPVRPMTGFGDPLFDPGREVAPERRQPAPRMAARSLANVAYGEFWQGAGVDRARLARALPQLPDTADELTAVAADLGVAAADIHLGRDASETTVKRARLSDYAIVYFATHGLVAGDVKGVAEPALALSIPGQPSDLDDGLLTASEVAQLKLAADWVVLSACNTIAGDRPGAEALSGLARAFFYAGAKALLVTHWAVDSAAATRLTTTTFDRLKAEPGIGRAEALRRAMLAYLSDTSARENAYPAFWGPFALIGEGAVR